MEIAAHGVVVAHRVMAAHGVMAASWFQMSIEHFDIISVVN